MIRWHGFSEQPLVQRGDRNLRASADGITRSCSREASRRRRHHCQFIPLCPTDLYSQIVFQGGAFLEALVTGWLEGQDASEWVETFEQHPSYDDSGSWGMFEPGPPDQCAGRCTWRLGTTWPSGGASPASSPPGRRRSPRGTPADCSSGPWTPITGINYHNQGELQS